MDGIPGWMLEIDNIKKLPLAIGLSLPRMVALTAILPFLSGNLITGLVKFGVVAALLLLVAPSVMLSLDTASIGLIEILVLIAKEAVIGLIIGFPFATIFWAIEGTGFFIDNQRGSAMASSIDPLTNESTSELGSLLFQAFTTVFFMSGGFLVLMSIVYGSYVTWPVAEPITGLSSDAGSYFLAVFDQLMHAIVRFSGPVIAAMFLAEFGLALISRFAPQLNVFFLAMPVKSAVAFFVLILYIPVIFSTVFSGHDYLEVIWSGIQGAIK